MAPAHESETIVFNFRKLLSTLPNYAELEQILLFSVNWGKQVWYHIMSGISFNRVNKFLLPPSLRKYRELDFDEKFSLL